ncbi:hypothetical protein ACQZ61_08195 [Agrobacterium vitis]|nr:hypothetical protein [Agrobacterium vitis]
MIFFENARGFFKKALARISNLLVTTITWVYPKCAATGANKDDIREGSG